MNLPKFNETFMPILETLTDGVAIHHRELIKRVRDRYYSQLPQELLQQRTKSGEILIENRIAWGKSYLKKGGLVHYPKRGMVQITDAGMAAGKQGVTLADLESNLLEFYAEEKTKDGPAQEVKRQSPQDMIDSGVSAIEAQTKSDLLERLRELDPFYFEKVILILLKKMGYGEFIETSKSGDGGVDGIIDEDKLGLEKIYIQAKRYTDKKVRETDIRNFIGAMSGDTRKGVFVTTSSFDAAASKKAREAHHTIILIDGDRLVDLMYQYNVGVQVRSLYEIKDVDADFFGDFVNHQSYRERPQWPNNALHLTALLPPQVKATLGSERRRSMSDVRDRWAAGSTYEDFMGRWSRRLAPQFVSWLQIPGGVHWLDVGCGTGALTNAICSHADPASVVGCDPAEPFIEFARKHSRDARASFVVAGVGSLPRRAGGVRQRHLAARFELLSRLRGRCSRDAVCSLRHRVRSPRACGTTVTEWSSCATSGMQQRQWIRRPGSSTKASGSLSVAATR